VKTDGLEARRRAELTGFLRTRRARLRPETMGLVTAGQRRVSGLRREETAQLAGVSVDYYIRLEQGRAGWPSDQVLSSVSRALRLSPEEEGHLFRLARPASALQPTRQDPVRPEVRTLLGSMDGLPAFVINGRMDFLACNDLASRLVSDCASTTATRDNVARMIFTDPFAHEYFADWETVAREAGGHLRLAIGRMPDDQDFLDFIDELAQASPKFREIWSAHDVVQKSHGWKRVRHPAIGEVTYRYETLTLPTDSDQMLVTYTAEPGSESEAALKRLAETDFVPRWANRRP
jgi:transcriptional regulator with XRE-family HTH domain